MFKYIIEGGNKLSGNVSIYGSKNTALTVIPAAILSDEPVIFSNLPHVQDVVSMASILSDLGASLELLTAKTDETMRLSFKCNQNIKTQIHYDYVSKMRASILLMGPMLARFGFCEISLPGGCAIGVRPVNLHIMAMEKLGAEVTLHDGYLRAIAKSGKLIGNTIDFPIVTVGGTENAVMAACLAEGETVINNAAIEPEITNLCDMLSRMGADISGSGTRQIRIQGKKSLHGAEYRVPSDRIQTFTYAIASAATGFGIKLKGADIEDFLGTTDVLNAIGIDVKQVDKNTIDVIQTRELLPTTIVTAPIPGFPTDCQAQAMALLSCVKGKSVVIEEMFENRMMHVAELNRMGANITLKGNTAFVEGVESLSGASVMATDLRASASLVIAGLMAKGKTTINRVYHIDRGYDFLPAKLEACGAKISKIFE